MVKVSTIKVVIIFMLLVLSVILFVKNNISKYYDGPMTISSSTTHQSTEKSAENGVVSISDY